MTTDTRKLAERAGATWQYAPLSSPDDIRTTFYNSAQLEEFARLVREEARQEDWEACGKVASAYMKHLEVATNEISVKVALGQQAAATNCQNEIRALSAKGENDGQT